MFDPARVPSELRRAADVMAARIEDAALTASQPREQHFYDGWLLRRSPGKARRARSVNAVAAGRLPLAEKIAHSQLFFARHGLPCLMRITPFSQPPELDAALAAAGWSAIEETRVMQRPLEAPPARAAVAVPCEELDAAGFGALLGELHGLDAVARAAERDRFAAGGLPGIYLAVREQGRAIACGCALVEGDLAGIYGMVTAEPQRRRGHARSILGALLEAAHRAGARRAYLQVSAANEAARRVYAGFGFTDCYAYWYRCAPGAAGAPR